MQRINLDEINCLLALHSCSYFIFICKMIHTYIYIWLLSCTGNRKKVKFMNNENFQKFHVSDRKTVGNMKCWKIESTPFRYSDIWLWLRSSYDPFLFHYFSAIPSFIEGFRCTPRLRYIWLWSVYDYDLAIAPLFRLVWIFLLCYYLLNHFFSSLIHYRERQVM